MIIKCAKNALETGLDVYVATDSKQIKETCDRYGVQSIMTPTCSTGTDRLAKAREAKFAKTERKRLMDEQGGGISVAVGFSSTRT